MSDQPCGQADDGHNRFDTDVTTGEASVSADDCGLLRPDTGARSGNGTANSANSVSGNTSARQKSRRQNGYRSGRKRSDTATYAALDLGTNNCRLLVATPKDRGFRVIDAFSRIVRLGEGLHATGRLSDDAMDRAVEALTMCADKLIATRADRMRLVATEACRQAVNGTDFLARVKKETGLSLEIVCRETEARLAASGCRSLIHPRARGAILFDIGGGSSEIAWIGRDDRKSGSGKRPRGFRLKHSISIPTGVVTLAERHSCDHITPEVFEEMAVEAGQLLDKNPGSTGITDALAEGSFHMLGTSGTVTTLAGIHLDLPRYDRRRIDGMWMKARDIENMTRRIVEMSKTERLENPCIGRDRADLVLAGCAILRAIRKKWPCQSLRVADRGLREGILVELMDADGTWRPPAERPQKRNGKAPADRNYRRRGNRSAGAAAASE